MDPPLINEFSFSPANPSAYSLAGIWPSSGEASMNGALGLWMRNLVLDNSANRGGSAEVSAVLEQTGHGRKRKDLSSHTLNNPKSTKQAKTSTPEAEAEATLAAGCKQKDQMSKALDPHKDYIHVRARRGQATDSHSLAERARREKISERMKILQDIVPGCKKIIGKALVLDEIINYIHSLQHQVEFLSMKLEAVNSRMTITTAIDGFSAKDSFDATAMMFMQREYAERSQLSGCIWKIATVSRGQDDHRKPFTQIPEGSLRRKLDLQVKASEYFIRDICH